jgi:hypothetical protein
VNGHPWLVLSSKVKAALVGAVAADLATLALGVSGGLPWIAVLATCLGSLAPVALAWNQTETTFPPLPPDAVAVPVAALAVPEGAVVTMPAAGNADPAAT